MRWENVGDCIYRTAVVCLVLALVDGCANPADKAAMQVAAVQPAPDETRAGQDAVATAVSLKLSGGTFLVPVTINNTLQVPFIVDSGASDVSIPADYVDLLIRTGSISENDFLGKRTYRLANGKTVPAQTFRLKSVQVGGRILQDVTGSVSIGSGGFLLGQSFLSRFRSWSVDNERKVLVLD
ncbi:MAG TPA: retropepsin-like aspartic protease [Acetobacteraceae bacterium]|nr:retropepsin-like aspartic protease [Acetobacteraceae bacterium]